ncbi:hypothetical protein [Salinicoccus albus]|uniref:hypothetical protein n=1 Tax=Salinicoccus albus TaxID=418756 RepID=UPI000369509A|nr:hypothetical protein [Salinicoccus albus]
MSGWLKIHRQMIDSSIFDNEKLFKIFMYCLMKASHKKHKQIVGQKVIELNPGQFVFGRKKASEELNMKESTVWSYMKMLDEVESLVINSNNKFSVITIVNWGFYQNEEENHNNRITTDEQQNNNRITTDEQQNNTNKNVKNGENVKNNNSALFEEWYNFYGKKKARPKAEKAFNSALKKHSYEDIKKGTEKFLTTVKDKQYQPFPATFLNQERFMDEFEAQEAEDLFKSGTTDPMADIKKQIDFEKGDKYE